MAQPLPQVVVVLPPQPLPLELWLQQLLLWQALLLPWLRQSICMARLSLLVLLLLRRANRTRRGSTRGQRQKASLLVQHPSSLRPWMLTRLQRLWLAG